MNNKIKKMDFRKKCRRLFWSYLRAQTGLGRKRARAWEFGGVILLIIVCGAIVLISLHLYIFTTAYGKSKTRDIDKIWQPDSLS